MGRIKLHLLGVRNPAVVVVVAEGDAEGDSAFLQRAQQIRDRAADPAPGIALEGGGIALELVARENDEVGLDAFKCKRNQLDGVWMHRVVFLGIGPAWPHRLSFCFYCIRCWKNVKFSREMIDKLFSLCYSKPTT